MDSLVLAADDGGSRLARDVARAVRDGRLGPGDRLPSLRQLASQYHISFTTARRAAARLEEAGVVRCARGSGIYVSVPAEAGFVYLLISQDEHVYGKIAHALTAALQDTAFAPVMTARRHDRGVEQFDRVLDAMQQRPPRAVVMQWSVRELDQAIARVCGAPTRVILTMRNMAGVPDTWMSVQADKRSGYRLVVDHLLSLGHRRIGLLTSGGGSGRKAQAGHTRDIRTLGHALRESGAGRHALTLHRLRQSASLPIRQHPTEDTEAIAGIAEWLSGEGRPSAVVGHDNHMVSTIMAARQLGMRVPDDLALVGLGNTPWAHAFNLTSIHFPEDLAGRRIAELITADDDRGRDTTHHVLIRPHLVVRSSSAGRPHPGSDAVDPPRGLSHRGHGDAPFIVQEGDR